jgi:hypothetical protein
MRDKNVIDTASHVKKLEGGREKAAQCWEWVKTRHETFLSQVSYGRSGRHWLAAVMVKVTGENLGIMEEWDPDNPFKIVYYHSHVPMNEIAKNLKSVLLIRDFRDCLISELYHHVYLWTWERGLEWPTETAFISAMQPGEHLLEGKIKKWRGLFEILLPLNTIVLQYERLCLFPDSCIRRLCDFMELPIVREPMAVIEEFDNEVIQMSDHSEKPRSFVTGEERYGNHCLKWQRDPKMNYLHEYIWEKVGDIMLSWGYTKDGHAANLLKE